MDRTAKISRKTNETDISVAINIDGSGSSDINTGVGFFDHMLILLAKHSLIDMKISCDGDLNVDAHHSVEDVGIALGEVFAKAVGDKCGIFRYGCFIAPMDETCVMTSIDISGRGSLYYDVNIPKESVGIFDTELMEEFFKSFCTNAGINAHIKMLAGTNAHHIMEGTFKSFAKSIRMAVSNDPRNSSIPSTKGCL